MRRRTAVATAVAVVAATALTAGVLVAGDRGGAPRHAVTRSASVETARGDLERIETVPGALGYGTPVDVVARRAGTVTWVPSAGAVVERGEALWRVDDDPVVLLYGALPLYRTLRVAEHAQTGRDVDLVAANLHALGFWHGRTRGAVYDRSLSEAVKTWQRRLGRAADGTVRVGDGVVTRGAVRVDAVKAQVADQAGGTVLTCTERTRAIVLKVPVGVARSLTRGTPVEVTLPDGRSVATRVTRIAPAADSGDSGGTASVSVVVGTEEQAPLNASALGDLSGRILLQARRDVVHVPVAALLALAGGGYALERPDHRLIRVRVGMVTEGQAEVSGVGVGAGVRVLVAS